MSAFIFNLFEYFFSQVTEITTVARTTVTGVTTGTAAAQYGTLTVTAANTQVPNFQSTTNADLGESLIIMNREFIKSMESISDPSCS